MIPATIEIPQRLRRFLLLLPLEIEIERRRRTTKGVAIIGGSLPHFHPLSRGRVPLFRAFGGFPWVRKVVLPCFTMHRIRASKTSSWQARSSIRFLPVPERRRCARSNSNSNSNSTIDGSYDASIVAQRLNHATAAILTDIDSTSNNNSSSSRFALSCKAMHQGDDFAIALQLLQNDIITLCIRAGVPISKLWPAEALLLNLHELDKFCQKQTSVDY
mmetsp:Transcript_4418/g.10410  ORF Transcript_4418/g.10410 Transcript_4418/m.10410 type:complete len:217 (+) Transcript_4418:13-663(+)